MMGVKEILSQLLRGQQALQEGFAEQKAEVQFLKTGQQRLQLAVREAAETRTTSRQQHNAAGPGSFLFKGCANNNKNYHSKGNNPCTPRFSQEDPSSVAPILREPAGDQGTLALEESVADWCRTLTAQELTEDSPREVVCRV